MHALALLPEVLAVRGPSMRVELIHAASSAVVPKRAAAVAAKTPSADLPVSADVAGFVTFDLSEVPAAAAAALLHASAKLHCRTAFMAPTRVYVSRAAAAEAEAAGWAAADDGALLAEWHAVDDSWLIVDLTDAVTDALLEPVADGSGKRTITVALYGVSAQRVVFDSHQATDAHTRPLLELRILGGEGEGEGEHGGSVSA